MKITHSLVALSLLGSSLMAAPIAQESGFSGFIGAGVTSLRFKSNMIAGNAIDTKINDQYINNIYDTASHKSSTLPSFTYNLKYTFAESQTEIFLGSSLESILTFDGSAGLGVRKNFDGIGIIGASLLFSTIPAKVWIDPYETTYERQSTDKKSSGISLKWEKIMESNVEVELRARQYRIDKEYSGLGSPYNGQINLGINNIAMLNELSREGDMTSAIVRYYWHINNENLFKTSLTYENHDLDGDAMKHKDMTLQLDYGYLGQKWDFVVNGYVGKQNYDNNNPLFLSEADSNVYGAGLSAVYKNPFGWSKKLSLIANGGYYNKDSKINFYDTSAMLINLGVLYHF